MLPGVYLQRVDEILGAGEALEQRGQPSREEWRFIARVGRNGERQQHARDGGVHAGLQKQHPKRNADEGVRQSAPHAEPIESIGQRKQRRGGAQGGQGHGLRVEQRNHRYGPEVVDNSERHQEHAKRGVNAFAQEAQAARGEGDIGGHGHAPSPCRGIAPIDGGEDRGRGHHAAHGRRRGQQRFTQ